MNLNKTQTKTIVKFTTRVENLQPKIAALLDELRDIMEETQHFADGLQEDFDEKSEKWQEGERGSKLDSAISELYNAQSSLQELETNLDADELINTIVEFLSCTRGDLDEEY